MNENMILTDPLNTEAQRLLNFLVQHALPNAIPGKPETYKTYIQAHKDLALKQNGETWGISLENQGMHSLGIWINDNNLPAITGLIVGLKSNEPSEGYFKLFKSRIPSNDKYIWWKTEIEKSKSFDWSPYISS